MTKILLVDDSEYVRKRICKVLSQHGYKVDDTGNALQVMEKYQAFQPDLVLCDVTIPEKDGIEIVKDIVAVDPSAKIIMLTALDEESVLLKAMHAGAKDCVLKPINQETLLEAIQRVLTEE